MAGTGKWHFIGVGGVGMSGLAKACLELGRPVSGSDLAASALTESLSALGAELHIGAHDAAYITDDLETVVVSSAIRPDNPELLAAGQRGIPVIHRGRCLALLMAAKKGVAVAGAHGKTTTSAMLAFLLERGGLAPAFFVGAYVGNLGTNAKWGTGEYLVAEADESDGSFLELSPHLALVTNVEDDHLDHYGSREKIAAAFLDFINKVPPAGAAVLCLDDPELGKLLPLVRCERVLTYGLTAGADLRGANLRCEAGLMLAEVYERETLLGTLRLRVYGRHNLQNALGALTAARECGLDFDRAAAILYDFKGAHRRLEYVGEVGGIRLYDDYAHHPTEIKAALEAAAALGGGRVLVVFQPHRYTRTQLLAQGFGGAFGQADELILLPVYSAGEEPIPGVDAGLIARHVQQSRGRRPALAQDFAAAAEMAAAWLRPGDLVLTMGAGDVSQAGALLLRLLSGGGED